MQKRLAHSKIPTYVGIYNSLYADITSGVYPENESLPGEVALAEKYNVSRNTLRQALAILCEDGLIVRAQGRGTIVAPRRETPIGGKLLNPMTHFAKEKVDSVEIQYNYGPPTDIARVHLKLAKGDLVLASDALYHQNETIIGYSFTQIPTALFNELDVDITREDAVEQLVTHLIFEHAQFWHATVKLVYANEMEASHLQIPEGTPLLLLEVLLYDGGCAPFARAKFYFRPEYYRLQFQL